MRRGECMYGIVCCLHWSGKWGKCRSKRENSIGLTGHVLEMFNHAAYQDTCRKPVLGPNHGW